MSSIHEIAARTDAIGVVIWGDEQVEAPTHGTSYKLYSLKDGECIFLWTTQVCSVKSVQLFINSPSTILTPLLEQKRGFGESCRNEGQALLVEQCTKITLSNTFWFHVKCWECEGWNAKKYFGVNTLYYCKIRTILNLWFKKLLNFWHECSYVKKLHWLTPFVVRSLWSKNAKMGRD